MNHLFFHRTRLGCLFVAAGVLAAAGLTGVAAANDQAPSHPLNGRRPALSPQRSSPELPAAAESVISAAIGRDQATYHATPTPGGFLLRNPRSNLQATFTRQGVQVERGEASWGMALQAYGAGGSLHPVKPAKPYAAGNRVEYRRAALVEWYLNGPAGLEQGVTITHAPKEGGIQDGTLELAFVLSGNLTPRLDGARKGLVLTSGAGQAQLRYTGLAAWDATGRELPSWLEVRGSRLLVHVAAAGARFPLVVDPYIQAAKLTASDGASDDSLGYSVSVSGDGSTVVAGAPSAGIGSNVQQGAAYVFVKSGSWTDMTQVAKLTASDGAAFDLLGISVSVSADGSTVVAGAATAKINSTAKGAVYIFEKPGSWTDMTETAKLTASDGVKDDYFGRAVSVSGDGLTVVAGAPLKAIGSNRFQGAVYVFASAGSWSNMTETARLTASGGAAEAQLGSSVGVSADGSTAVAGARIAQNLDTYQGAAYVFVRPGSGWAAATQTAKLTASDGVCDTRGASVSVSGDGSTVVVGAPLSNSNQGAAYVFVNPGSWIDMTETARLTASDGVAGDSLGYSVDVNGDGSTVVAGARNATVASNPAQGAAYLFVNPGSWIDMTETDKLTASNGGPIELMGSSVSVSADDSTVAAGAPYAFVGSNYPQGAVYVFGPSPCTGTGVSLSASLVDGSPTPAAGGMDTWTVKLDAHACQAATGLTIQGGTNGWTTFTSVDPPAIGWYDVEPHKKNEVITWTVNSLDAGQDAVLTLEITGTIDPDTPPGTVLDLIGPWSVVFSTDGGATYQKSDYTAPVTVTVTVQ